MKMFRLLLLISFCAFAASECCDSGRNGCSSNDILTSMCTGCAPRTSRKCYKVVCSVQVNWIGGNNYCNSLGMRLATVENAQQHNEVLRAIRNSACPQDNVFLWIGGSNLGGGYVWMPTGQPVIYRAFLPGQPDNPTTERCFEYRQGGWNDRDCGAVQAVICESVQDCRL